MIGTKRSHNHWANGRQDQLFGVAGKKYSRRPFGDVSGKSPDAKDGAKLLGHVVQLFFWEIWGQSIDVDIRGGSRIWRSGRSESGDRSRVCLEIIRGIVCDCA